MAARLKGEREKEEEVEEELIQLIRRGLSSLNCSTPGGGSGGSGVGVGSEQGKGKEIIQGSFLSLLSLFVCALHCTAGMKEAHVHTYTN